MEINYKTTKGDFLKNYLELVSCFFGLTKTELQVLTLFTEIYLKLSISEEDAMVKTFSTEAREYVVKQMSFKSRVNVDQYIKRLKKKKAISKGLELHPIVIPKSNQLIFNLIVE